MKIRLKYYPTKDQIADIFTKALPIPIFELQCTMLGVIEFASRRSIKV